jgi:penicillin-insensitive murein endopeptidase
MMTRLRTIARKTILALAGVAAFAGAFEFETRPVMAEELAKNLFGAEKLPAATEPQSFGFYSKGCFTGGVAIPLDGDTWTVMRPRATGAGAIRR